jgi:cobalt-zinc-cadmium efflux system protein
MGGSHHHSHAGHDDQHAAHHAPRVTQANERRVGLAALLTGVFMLAEIAGGLVSGSLALLADAGHMLADFGALALAWFGFRLARRPADWRRTYGYDRFSVLVAFVNGLTLFVVAALIVWEAAERLLAPRPVAGGMMLAVAVAGLLINLLAFRLLAGADRHDLNVRGALAHVLGDLVGSLAAIVAAAVILVTGWTSADPLLSVVVAAIIVRSGWGVTRDAGHILLEGAPVGLSRDAIGADLVAHVEGLAAVRHVHLWSISQSRPVLTLEAETAAGADPHKVKAAIKARLRDQHHIDHTTIEMAADDDGRRQACR